MIQKEAILWRSWRKELIRSELYLVHRSHQKAGMEVVMKYIVYSYYSRDLSQKIKTVMSTRKSKGEFVAAQPPYGYMKDPDVKRKIIPNPDTAPVVRKIFDLALEGKTPAEIAV